MSNDTTDLDEARECSAKDPYRALELTSRHIARYPTNSRGYFSRHLTWSRLGEYQKALEDCTHAIQLEPKCGRYICRGEVYRALGDHTQALADFNRAHDMNFEEWRTSFGPHLRADTLARLGRLDDALADSQLIGDNHWMPAHLGLPGGDKQQFIAEIKRRAAMARPRRKTL